MTARRTFLAAAAALPLAPGAAAGGGDLLALRGAAEAAYARYSAAVAAGGDDDATETAFADYDAAVRRMTEVQARDGIGFAAKAAVVARGVFDGFAECEAALMESLAADAAAVLA